MQRSYGEETMTKIASNLFRTHSSRFEVEGGSGEDVGRGEQVGEEGSRRETRQRGSKRTTM